MEQDRSTVTDLEENIRLIKEEVNTLKATTLAQKGRWYKNLPTWISILALLLSFGVAYFSYVRAKAQDVQNTKVELRGLLQRLSVLPREYYEITQKYSNDPSMLGAVQSNFNEENAFLSLQAAELARKLPRSSVSATEWYSIGVALKRDLNYEAAKEFLGYAIESAKSFSEKTAVLRANASLLFVMGMSGPGRVEYQKALNIFSEFEGYDDYTKNTTHLQTCIHWAYSELYAGFKDEANQILTKAESYLSKIPPGSGDKEWRYEIEQARRQINSPAGLPTRPPTVTGNATDQVILGTKPSPTTRRQPKPPTRRQPKPQKSGVKPVNKSIPQPKPKRTRTVRQPTRKRRP
jgi:hypothetical protein